LSRSSSTRKSHSEGRRQFGLLTPDKLIGNFKVVTGGITLAMIFISSIALMVGGVGGD
jgi:hypothetical protein